MASKTPSRSSRRKPSTEELYPSLDNPDSLWKTPRGSVASSAAPSQSQKSSSHTSTAATKPQSPVVRIPLSTTSPTASHVDTSPRGLNLTVEPVDTNSAPEQIFETSVPAQAIPSSNEEDLSMHEASPPHTPTHRPPVPIEASPII